jgi:glycosyltransferase involved in cell wall biosynthesis
MGPVNNPARHPGTGDVSPGVDGAGRSSRRQPDRPILMITGGGLENGGGIGRMVGYVMGAWNDAQRPPMQVIDTRGPKYRLIVWPFFMLRSILQIVGSAHRRPILHIHIAANSSTWRKWIIVRVGRLLGLPYIVHLHDPVYPAFYNRQPQWVRSGIRALFTNAAGIVALGTPAATAISELFGIPGERIDIIPNGVPGPSALVRDDETARTTPPHILFLGQLQRRKGVHDLIDALARPEVSELRWRATVAGGGPEQAGFEAQAVERGVRDRITFPGWLPLDGINALLEAADILVLPSYAEEMAMSVLEGMAFGLCVVCTPVGALAEVVENNVSALVTAPGDVEGLAKALATCIADPALRRRLGDEARRTYLGRFNVADYPERIAAIYQRIAQSNR